MSELHIDKLNNKHSICMYLCNKVQFDTNSAFAPNDLYENELCAMFKDHHVRSIERARLSQLAGTWPVTLENLYAMP